MAKLKGVVIACSRCFNNEGLRLTAERVGAFDDASCQTCGNHDGRKLDEDLLMWVASDFFVRGTFHRTDYGGAPLVQFNTRQRTNIRCGADLSKDLMIFEEKLGVGFFLYGPRLCMIGEIDPLLALESASSRAEVIARLFREYPTISLDHTDDLYRVRVGPKLPADPAEYDAPPPGLSGRGRLDTPELPVMYTSPDLDICIHECRVTADDEIYVATVSANRRLSLLDLTAVLNEDVSEFESLDLAIHMLFLAGDHSYKITRDIAAAAAREGFDGIVYPSYFSLLRTGAPPFASSFGLLHRRIPQMAEQERSKIIQNVALLGRPVAEGKISVRCINRVQLRRVQYDLVFGPSDVT